jgi:tRNA A-37 threonylcarbamoyl transferase component Bud32
MPSSDSPHPPPPPHTRFAQARSLLPAGDATLDLGAAANVTATGSDPQRNIHLVEGSGNGLTGEVCGVLRSRLRMASILLAAGLGSFLLWRVMQAEFLDPGQLVGHAMHWFATVCCVYAAVSLCQRRAHSHAKLRFFEYSVFGVVALYFLVAQYMAAIQWAAQDIPPSRNVGPWNLLTFTYALLIPNTWRRALPLLAIFALAPIVVLLALLLTDENIRHMVMRDPSLLVEFVLSSAITFGVAIIGVHSINRLRTEAYEARQIGQYRLKQRIGSGGMGEVYLAEHRMMKRPCAIKVIRADKAGDPLTLARFEREVRATAKLSHWNTIDIYDYGRTDDGTFYYVMEYLPGMNLNELVQTFGALPADRVVYLMRQAADALTEAHKISLVHRDLKPANIFSAVRGGSYDVVKLLDFGLAKPMHSFEQADLTQEGSITGSPLFMSPEQATGDREPDARSDIYSLGAVMYYLLTGRPPFNYEKPLKVIIAHSNEPAPAIDSLVDGVPLDLQRIVMRCLEKNPDDRFQDAEQLTLALDAAVVAGGWSRKRAADWWNERCSDGVCYWEPPATTADLSLTLTSLEVTRA